MTNQHHPITPPPELVEDWIEIAKPLPQRPPNPGELATLAARWGADQELEACCEWISKQDWTWTKAQLVAARRPKPPSLKDNEL
jgi:predicted secreted protein